MTCNLRHPMGLHHSVWQSPLKMQHLRSPPNRNTHISQYLAVQIQIDFLIEFEFIPENRSFWIRWIWGWQHFQWKLPYLLYCVNPKIRILNRNALFVDRPRKAQVMSPSERAGKCRRPASSMRARFAVDMCSNNVRGTQCEHVYTRAARTHTGSHEHTNIHTQNASTWRTHTHNAYEHIHIMHTSVVDIIDSMDLNC